MRNGTVLGAVCGLVASGVLIGGMSLMEPSSEPPAAIAPEGPSDDRPEPLGRARSDEVPDSQGRRLSVPSEPELGASFGASSVVRAPGVGPTNPPDERSAAPAPADRTAAPDGPGAARSTVALPSGSEFNRPPEDRAIAPPAAAPAPSLAPAVRSPLVARQFPEAPRAETRTSSAPRAGDVVGFAGDPASGRAPVVPVGPAETAPRPSTEARVPEPDVEPAAAIDDRPPTETDASSSNARGPEETLVASSRSERSDAAGPTTRMGVARPVVSDDGFTKGTAGPARARLATQAIPFDDPDGRPLMSIVLLDGPVEEATRAGLDALDLPLTFAVDPARADVSDTARRHREAGHEVAMLGHALVADGTAEEAEIATDAALRAIPQALAVVVETVGSSGDGKQLDALLPLLQRAGMGFVVSSSGAETDLDVAADDVPTRSVDRTVARDATAAALMQELDRAASDAERSGSALVVGPVSPKMLWALRTWSERSRAGRVALAPLSAVLGAR